MKTAYFTLTTQDALEQAAGEGAGALWVRTPPAPRGAGKVIDLAAWKARKEQEALEEDAWTEEDELAWLLETEELPPPPERRPRRAHPSLPLRELAATLSAVCAAAALVLWALAF